MGIVRIDLVHFCPIDDYVTRDAIIYNIAVSLEAERQIAASLMSIDEDW